MTLQPGTYFIGDLSYVLPDKVWQRLIEHTEDGFFEVKGVSGFYDSTCYGDGRYYDQYGNEYPVDTGTIGIVPVSLCLKKQLNWATKENAGKIENFTSPFTPNRSGSGTFTFGHITIVTDDSDEQEERDDSYCSHCERSCNC